MDEEKGLAEIAKEEFGKEDAQASEQAQAPQTDELDKDEGFQREVSTLEKELGSKPTFGQTQRFRDVYRQNKEAQRKIQELEEQIRLSGESQEDEEVEPETTAPSKQAQETLADLASILDKIEDPVQRKWWESYANAIVAKITGEIKPFAQETSNMLIEHRLEQSERQARKLIENINAKHGLKIDFDKDVDPELAKMLKANKSLTPFNTDMVRLTKDFLAEKGIEFGKKLSQKEANDLNDQKRRANVEISHSSHSPSAGSDENKSFKEIMREEMQKENISSF